MNENVKKSWPAETPQIDITYIKGKEEVISSIVNRYLELEILGPKGVFGKQNRLWMDLEVSKVSNVRRKVIFCFSEIPSP